ncbi:MAG: metallophosphoesterase [Candidatus Sedimenticola endophacoides]|uniref:Metallophosphoesterase n=1 Tax=Candidatus Sedimenticola endophacoides TaxID=2548426 RepID=A0A6N4DP89_9GAMM|nr:MAG: metallophosphoesterase [Candidatus Sedimenticola endophacoides]OQX33745.1 MAG: metallophosphoesterase [Candidatus Sedimenticola endophacoides]OQX40193.1 MAG: metallophosphoesterase [Candidatus Sedimenticola endophacoides]PUD99157.1 MAG: metallophosphoesterase [Candidatus Sedimenticola endophacoides]PUE00099.1 MAG: metallophosphoesterase [Candidatus Sedimenticola endophacoides]
MRVAVFSDVQANLPAMEVVAETILRWAPDLVVLAGDLVNRGPRNRECLDLYLDLSRRLHCVALRGNHEDYLLHCASHPPLDPHDAALRRFADWSASQLGARVRLFERWADHLDFPAEGWRQWVHVTHGTLLGNRNGISASIPDAGLERKLPPQTELFVTAHTHKVHRRTFQGTHILNIGSVGSPFDGDTRSSHARLEFRNGAWHGKIVRLGYDRQRMERDCRNSGFLDQGGPLARVIFEEWRRATLLMPHWNRRYRQAVLEGRISMERAVAEFMGGL